MPTAHIHGDPDGRARRREDRKTTYINIPEAVGVFDTFEAQQAAFYDLRSVYALPASHWDFRSAYVDRDLAVACVRSSGSPRRAHL